MKREMPAFLALLLAVAGCGGSSKKEYPQPGDPGTAERQAAAAAKFDDTSGDAGLPGPPGTARPPASRDPDERALEERLFRTDGGRVVLRSIRAHGGWKRWLEVKEIRASIRSAAPEGAAGGGAGAPAAVETVTIADPTALPATDAARILTAPFWFGHPGFLLEYLGVVVERSGETYDKVKVFQERPGSGWAIAYFNRRTGILERLLEAKAGTAGGPEEIRRVDLGAPREVAGLWFAAQHSFFRLRNRFDRPEKADRIASLEISVGLKEAGPAPGPPAQ